jgi:7,8-dihydropterin-6-yl-methyl-4-(beta-D-ribofuranosyl)aminobenzene 5'-phosphate synthase
MSLQDKWYAVRWAISGLTEVSKTRDFLRARKEIEAARRGAGAVPPLKDLGTVTKLSILPLVEFYSSDERLVGESGVSYLLTVEGPGDGAGGASGRSPAVYQILFDAGCNEHDEEPSPLLRNMRTLGIGAGNLDAVFISHCHLDHVGGRRYQEQRSFSLSKEQVDLGGIPAYVPTAMSHPSARVEYVGEPRKLGEGLASIGPLDKAIWLMGPVAEQSLLVNVAGKGPVLIVGCGHPSLARIVERAQAVASAPLYGIVGGLHFPVTGSRVGKGRQNIIGNGKFPWQRITRKEAGAAADALARLDHMELVALSAHDSCDWTLEMFAAKLGGRFRTVRVGEEIVVTGTGSRPA